LDAALTKVLQTTPRPPREAGRVIADEGGSGATALTDFLSTGKYI
jgi:electron transfer flavoprotein beta subunit